MPTTLLSERHDRNQIEENINTETNLTLLVDKLDSPYQPLSQSHNIYVILLSRYSFKYLDKNNIIFQVCDDSAPPLKTQTINELHSL